MSRYKYTKLLKLGPVDGFMIHTPDDRKLKDTHPQTIVRELNRMADRINRLEEALEGTVKWIVHLADSGDAGFWNPEEQSVIIEARAALQAKEAKP